MTVLYYGVKITTAQTTLTDYSLGIVNGIAQWVMGRPGFSGWKEGIIADDTLSPVSQEIEISAGGSYGTMSGFSFAISNNVDQAQRIKALGINFVQADIEFWTWRDGVSTVDHKGKIADYSYDEEVFKFEVMDSFRGIHKAKLTSPIDLATFPNAPADSLGKFIPVTLGFVSKAALINVGGPSDKLDLIIVGGVTKKECAAQGALSNFNKTVPLYTLGISFGVNSGSLVGRYLSVISGGTAQFTKIVSNLATAADITSVTVENPLDVSVGFVAWAPGVSSTTQLWMFEIVSQSFASIISQNQIFSFEKNADGQTVLYEYDSNTKGFLDLSEASITFDLSNIDSSGHPGFEITSNLDSDGVFSAYFPIIPSDVKFLGVGVSTSWSGSNVFGASQPNLFDRDQATYYTLVGTEIDLKVLFPADGISKSFDDIYILFDITHKITSGSGSNRSIKVTVRPYDIYDQTGAVGSLPNAATIYFSDGTTDPVLTSSYADFFLLPGVYYGGNISSDYFYKRKAALSISSVIDSIKKSTLFPAVVLVIEYSISTTDIRVKEVGFVGKKNINVSTETLYAKSKGEVFADTWDSRRTAGGHIKNIGDACEHFFRAYDQAASFVDEAAFDLVANPIDGILKDCYVGRQLMDGTSYDAINELCIFGFFGLVPKANGKRAPKCWTAGAVVATHTDTNGTIIEGTIGARVPTPLANLFNEPQVNYAWNPASEKYDAFLKMDRLDDAAFPAEATLAANGVAAWKSYAIGYNDDEYAEAKTNWDLCKLSATRYGVRQALPDDMANAQWFPNIEADWGLAPTYNAAKAYMRKLCSWTPFRKDVIPYRLPNTATHASLELLDKIAFNDSVQTNGVTEYGWIVRKAITPGNGKDEKDYIDIDLMLAPVTT